MSEDVIVRYLLGELPEDEQVRVEERAFADRRYTQNIVAVESDLIDEYVRGEMSGPQRRRFESRFLASAERRQKVEFARALARVVPAARRSQQPLRWRSWRTRTAFFRDAPPAFRFAMAASLLLVVGASWWITERYRLQPLEHGPLRPGSAIGTPLLAELFLPPDVGRGSGGRPQLELPESGVSRVHLRLGLEPEDDFPGFRVELRTAGREVWVQDGLHPRPSAAGRVVDLTIPGDVLGAGPYELRLVGVTDPRTSEDVRYYDFLVLKP